MAPKLTKIYGAAGHFRISVKHPSGRTRDITTFRGIPVPILSYSSADPFGDASAMLHFPMVTIFDRPGYGDLWWWVPWASITITWYEIVEGVPTPSGWVWEGNIASEEIGDDQRLQLRGALYMADNFEAAPFYPLYPVPYEVLIKRALDPKLHPSLRNKAMKIEWPADWNVKVPAFDEPSYLWFLRPWGVSKGDRWSGLTSHSTGSWEDTLTGYVQTLLSTMFTPEGDQWTLMKANGRIPVLRVRQQIHQADDTTLVVNAGIPGVKVAFSRDFSQSANVIYGAGTDLAGTSFSGAQVSTDGETTFYEPFAALPQVHPATASNPRLLSTMSRKEARITFPQGIDELSAREIAASQIRRFADPGYAGTINLDVDPLLDNRPFNRMLIRAGQQILVKGVRGMNLIFHIAKVDVTPEGGGTVLTVDTKFRDALTIEEVRARTRDALDPVNLLQIGKRSVTVNDLLKPWSYSEGSGVIPSGSKLDATALFKKMDNATRFPWTEWTAKYPPKKYPKYYVKLTKKGNKARDRWQDNGYTSKSKKSLGIPVKAAQNGSIRLLQIAAYNRDGQQVPVRFHAAFYTNSGITSNDMPMIPKDSKNLPYDDGDRYPFFPSAFESVKPTGAEQNNPNVLLPEGADLVIGWGNYYDPAGYSPGLRSTGSKKTGRLVDEATWSFDTSSVPGFDKYSVKNNAKNKTVGMLYMMIYCDDTDQDLYFLGRMFISSPGAT